MSRYKLPVLDKKSRSVDKRAKAYSSVATSMQKGVELSPKQSLKSESNVEVDDAEE